MRQVPRYAILGNGRMAAHMQHYLTELGLPYLSWRRGESLSKINKASHWLVLLSDESIEPFIKTHSLCSTTKTLIHFSGCLTTPLAHSAHPLQTFTQHLYSMEDYKKIPFIIEKQGPDFNDLLPGFPNPHYRIPKEKKPMYHALCVMANNFSTLLWQEFFSSMENHFSICPNDLIPYLEQSMNNLKRDPLSALTGPISRGDIATLNTNLNAMSEHPMQDIFKTFIDYTYTTKHSLIQEKK